MMITVDFDLARAPPQKRVSQLWFPLAKISLESVGGLDLPEPSWLKAVYKLS
jgi:hypothetical protein